MRNCSPPRTPGLRAAGLAVLIATSAGPCHDIPFPRAAACWPAPCAPRRAGRGPLPWGWPVPSLPSPCAFWWAFRPAAAVMPLPACWPKSSGRTAHARGGGKPPRRRRQMRRRPSRPPADGHTLFPVARPHHLHPAPGGEEPWLDPVHDFVSVGGFATFVNAFAVSGGTQPVVHRLRGLGEGAEQGQRGGGHSGPGLHAQFLVKLVARSTRSTWSLPLPRQRAVDG